MMKMEILSYIAEHSSRGVREGRVLGSFLFCLAMAHVYKRLAATLGTEGALYSYLDDAYFLAKPEAMVDTLTEALILYMKVGLRLA